MEEKQKFIIVDNKETRLVIRHLYEELSEYIKYLFNVVQAEVNAPNKDIALKINQILMKNVSKILVHCPNCKTDLAYNDLINTSKDDKIINELTKENSIMEECLFEIFDHLNNRNLFKDLDGVIEMCMSKGFKPSYCYKYILEKFNFKNEEVASKVSSDCESFITDLVKKYSNSKYMDNIFGKLSKEGGCGIKKDISTSVKYLQKGVDKKYPPACNTLGYMYLQGVDKIFKDSAEAVKLFEIGANEKDTNCLTNLGWCYDYGEGVEQNHKKAFDLYLEAAYLGNIKAMSNVGYSYRHGQGCEKNPKKCIEWLAKSSELGDPSGQQNLGFCYEIGFGVKEDKNSAFRLFMNAAESGYGPACNNVGFCYENGYGVKKDLNSAFYWYKKGAEQNHARSMTYVGFFYLKGLVVKQNTESAIEWFNKAIKLGDSEAKYAIEFVRKEYKDEQPVNKRNIIY